jgi:hypothetical protein
VYLLVLHACFYLGFEFLKGSLRDVFKSRSVFKGLREICVQSKDDSVHTVTFMMAVNIV